MISLEREQLVFRFPHINEFAGIRIDFQRTLRIPDNGYDYDLPPAWEISHFATLRITTLKPKIT